MLPVSQFSITPQSKEGTEAGIIIFLLTVLFQLLFAPGTRERVLAMEVEEEVLLKTHLRKPR